MYSLQVYRRVMHQLQVICIKNELNTSLKLMKSHLYFLGMAATLKQSTSTLLLGQVPPRPALPFDPFILLILSRLRHLGGLLCTDHILLKVCCHCGLMDAVLNVGWQGCFFPGDIASQHCKVD